MNRIIAILILSSCTLTIYSQVDLDASKDLKKMNAKQITTASAKAQKSASIKTIPAGQWCKLNVSYRVHSKAPASKDTTVMINNVIADATADDCAKNICKVELVNAMGKRVNKGWQLIIDKGNAPLIDAKPLAKGKYTMKFSSGNKKAERVFEF